MRERLKVLEKHYQIEKETTYKSDQQEAYLRGLRYAIYLLKGKNAN